MAEAPRSGAPGRSRRKARPRARRTHAERTAETRARLVAAVVESVAEVGFQRTTAAEIAGRAGVTWGAVQHHFGGKDGMLRAVLEDSFARFAARFEDLPREDASLEATAALFVERAWEHFGSPHFASTFEILMAALPREESQDAPSLQAQMLDSWDGVLERLFGTAALPPARRRHLGHYAFAVLCGLAASARLRGTRPRAPATELALLRDTLVRELGQPATGSARSPRSARFGR